MGLLTISLCFLLLAAPPQEKETRPAYSRTPEELAVFRKELEAALAPEADPKQRMLTIRRSRNNVDASVIALLDQKALRHPDRTARDQAVDALGHMQHPDALAVLVEMLKRDDEELKKEPPRYANLIRAIARKGAPETVPLLVKDLFESPERGVVQARILGLANIRTRASVDELMQIMRSVAPARMGEFMLEMRTSLYLLTGVDKGTSQPLWLAWYGDAKDKLVIAPEPPEEMAPEVRKTWTNFWGPERARSRGEPDHGEDPGEGKPGAGKRGKGREVRPK